MAPSFHLLTWSEITVLQSGHVFSLLNHKEMHSSQNVCCNEKNDSLELLSSSVRKEEHYLHSLISKDHQKASADLTLCSSVYQFLKTL